MPTLAGDAMALGCALAWTAAVLLFRRLRDHDPTAVNLFKNSLATLLLLGTMAIFSIPFEKSRTSEDWLRIVVSGTLGLAVADTLFLMGLRRVDGSVVAVVDCIYSPAVISMAFVALGERLDASVLLGGPLVLLGLVIVAMPEAAHATRRVDRDGVLLCLAGVLTTAAGVVIAKPVLERSSLVEVTTLRLAVGTISLAGFEVAAGRGRRAIALFRPQPAWRHAIPAGVVGTYVSMLLWLGGNKWGDASRTALLNQTGSAFLLIASWLAGEAVSARRWGGAALAIGGAFAIVAAREP